MKKVSLMLFVFILFLNVLSAVEVTDVREWRSSNGHHMSAKATAFENDEVTLKKADGKVIHVKISQLSQEDQDFVKGHFLPEKALESKLEPVGVTRRAARKGRGKRGVNAKILGPQKSSEESSYYYYVPESSVKSRKVPAVFWVGGGKAGNAKDIQRFLPAADLTGMTIIACSNSSNKSPKSSEHIDSNLKHSIEQCNVDKERVFFSGPSGGAARTFRNASKYELGGAMPIVGYIPSGTKPSRKAYYYVVAGAYDFNRYSSAFAAKSLGKNAVFRLGTGGHSVGSLEILNDGLIWLYTRDAYSNKEVQRDELDRFEERFYTYLKEGLANEPWKAYYWTDHLLNTCKISGINQSKFKSLHSQLESDEQSVRYLEGIVALQKFGEKYLAAIGTGSKMKHTTPEIVKAANKLVAKYAGVPEIEAVAKDLAKKTDKL